MFSALRRAAMVLAACAALTADLPLMLWLVSSAFNVDWTASLGLSIAIAVAVLGTCGAASALHHLVCDLRADKDDRGRLSCARLPAGSTAVLIATALLTILIAVLMCVRVYIEGKLSGVEELAVLLAVELMHRYELLRLRTQRDRGRPGAEDH